MVSLATGEVNRCPDPPEVVSNALVPRFRVDDMVAMATVMFIAKPEPGQLRLTKALPSPPGLLRDGVPPGGDLHTQVDLRGEDW